MLFERARERERKRDAESLERITLAVNNGLAISRDKDARRAFENARARRAEADAPAGTPGQSLAEYQSTKARLAARFPLNVRVH